MIGSWKGRGICLYFLQGQIYKDIGFMDSAALFIYSKQEIHSSLYSIDTVWPYTSVSVCIALLTNLHAVSFWYWFHENQKKWEAIRFLIFWNSSWVLPCSGSIDMLHSVHILSIFTIPLADVNIKLNYSHLYLVPFEGMIIKEDVTKMK